MRNKIATITTLLLSAIACANDEPQNAFITLGTIGGPVTQVDRSQPANALIVYEDLYFVDAGDGAVGQLTRAGFELPEVDGLFISHLHFDHTGGVLAILGLRRQLRVEHMLNIYGPPGTQTFIDGLIQGMAPALEAAYGMPGVSWQANVSVEELVQGSTIELPGMTVHVAENTHYAIPEDSGQPKKAKALSFRFDLEDRSIVYTGDTGPSEAVEELAKGADLYISEMMDIDKLLRQIKEENPHMPPHILEGIEWHFRAHHVEPQQVGEMATRAGVKKLVITHMSPNVRGEEMTNYYLDAVGEYYDGEAIMANDLDRF